MSKHFDVIIIGAGAAGLFCALNTAVSKRVLVLDHANKVGKKILMSGGGRCNFTNLNTTYEDFTSENPHFCKSAINQYSPYSFLSLVEKHNIEYVEKAPGQLFCKHSSKDILNMLLDECANHGVKIYKKCSIKKITKDDVFHIKTSIDNFTAEALVVATGGLSIPTLGASGYGYEVAEKFGHRIIKTRPSLVPFILENKQLEKLKTLSGVATPVVIKYQNQKNKIIEIEDDMLFTHRGISGPAVLKMSAYWEKGHKLEINLLPGKSVIDYCFEQIKAHPEQLLVTSISHVLPKRLAQYLCANEFEGLRLKQLNAKLLEQLSVRIHYWSLFPAGNEGYKTAEVTDGGVDTENISSKTMESKLCSKLYFIGEVLDVTGQLGGFNFQWAWSSAWCASQNIIKY